MLLIAFLTIKQAYADLSQLKLRTALEPCGLLRLLELPSDGNALRGSLRAVKAPSRSNAGRKGLRIQLSNVVN